MNERAYGAKNTGFNMHKNRGQYMGRKYDIPKPIYRKKTNT